VNSLALNREALRANDGEFSHLSSDRPLGHNPFGDVDDTAAARIKLQRLYPSIEG
tara:strand:- start:10527 stop:10691 length:165 start_codon:yes stop_codon:yes gene_type:complete